MTGAEGSKGPRGKYARLLCLGCRERRIRCELPSEVEIPNPGEFRTVRTPCYRCKRLGVPCVVRQTILGRPSPDSSSTYAAGGIVSRIIIDLSPHSVAHTQPGIVQGVPWTTSNSVVPRPNDRPMSKGDPPRRNGGTLLIHKPQSTETVIIIRAIDILRREKVEEEWFRHLPAYVGHTRTLDLSIKALVAACAYSRAAPKLTSGDCYQALALALNAVQADIKQSDGKPNEAILASTALLAPFEGVMKKNGILTCLHVEGLAAILAARSAISPDTQLARDILDFHACESAVMACIQDNPSPFETIDRAYFANNRMGYNDSDQALLKGLGNELFIRIPRLVRLVRLLRLGGPQHNELFFDALQLSRSLLNLQDPQAEGRLLRNAKVQTSNHNDFASPLNQTLHFDSAKDFEAVAYYWQARLSLLRLEWHLYHSYMPNDAQIDKDYPGVATRPNIWPKANEVVRLIKNIVISSEYAVALPLRRQNRLFAHAMVVVWGVTMDMPDPLGRDCDEEGASSLSAMLLRGVNKALQAKQGFTAEDMDIAADIFVGGQPKGRFAELYGL